MTDERKPRALNEYTEDMLKSIHRLLTISGVNEESFKVDEDKQDAAIRHIEALGEIAGKLVKHYPIFVSDNKEIPFKQISDMRNKLIHNYFGVSLDAIWKVLKSDVPALNRQLANLVVTEKNSIPKGKATP
jgi:uncharacterized protein with HEPN domain